MFSLPYLGVDEQSQRDRKQIWGKSRLCERTSKLRRACLPSLLPYLILLLVPKPLTGSWEAGQPLWSASLVTVSSSRLLATSEHNDQHSPQYSRRPSKKESPAPLCPFLGL